MNLNTANGLIIFANLILLIILKVEKSIVGRLFIRAPNKSKNVARNKLLVINLKKEENINGLFCSAKLFKLSQKEMFMRNLWKICLTLFIH